MRHALLTSLLALAACAPGPDVAYVEFPDPIAEDGKADDPAAPVLPACTSELARAILTTQDGHGRTALNTLRNATLPADYFATEKNHAGPEALVQGPQIFPAMAELIAQAQYNVDLQTYVWENDTDPTNEILGGLQRLGARVAAERPDGPPVRVRILLDASGLGFGSKLSTVPRTYAAIAALGLDPRAVTVEIGYYYHTAFGNLHVKSVVADGRDAILTGANPQAHHDYAQPWYDAGYRLEGAIATALSADFANAWGRGYLWTCGAREDLELDQCSKKPRREPVAILPSPELDATCMPMFVVGRKGNANPFQNGIDNPQDQAFLGAFRSARSHLHMLTPNLNDDAAKAGLLAAAAAGTRVEIVLSREFNDGTEKLPGQGGTNDKNVADLYAQLAARVPDVAERCARLEIRWYSVDGVTPVYGNGVYASHAKYLSIDDAAVIVGTANMDTQSWNNSREVNVLVDDPSTAQAWDAQVFSPAWARSLPTLPAECASAP